MLVLLALIIPAILSAAIVALGRHSDLAQYDSGLTLIFMSRRLQWPLVTFSLVLCLALLALVIAGKRRVYWLLGLLPVLGLLGFRFGLDSMNALQIVDQPSLATAAEGSFLADEDWIVGLTLNDRAIAFPYSVLFRSPVVVYQDFDKRILLIWSAFANRGLAFEIDRELRARDIDIVSIPANSLLIYNSRLGEFINGITGLTQRGARPTGVKSQLPLTRTPWGRWKQQHPQSSVMKPLHSDDLSLPAAPVLPKYPMPASPSLPVPQSIVVIWTPKPVALLPEQITTQPLNLKSADVPFVVFRESSVGAIRAFDRRVEDLTPRFSQIVDARNPKAFLVDSDSNTRWTARGLSLAADGDFKGRTLTPILAEEAVYWGVMKYWFPDLEPYTSLTGRPDSP